jgi:hypothetical protein
MGQATPEHGQGRGDGEPRGDGAYGPRGYLPEQAAHRARKIILRERMGLGWPVAAALASLCVAAAGAFFLLRGASPPGEPFTRAGGLEQVPPGGETVIDISRYTHGVLVTRVGGLAAFAAPAADSAYCPASGYLEASSGSVWSLGGRLLAGPGSSLQPVAVRVAEGQLYLSTEPGPAPPPTSSGPPVEPACLAAQAGSGG